MSRWMLLGLLWMAVSPAQAQVERPPQELPKIESQGSPPLSESTVVALMREHNPQLKASLLELESARWDVFGSEAAYEPVLVLDGSGSQVATPNVFGNTVRINRIRRGDLGAEIRKHLLWGTDISLRLSSSIYKSAFSSSLGGLSAVGGTGNTTTSMNLPATGFAGIGTFGPVYAATAKLTLKQPLWRGRGRDVGEASMRESRAQRTASEYTRDRVSSELLRDALTAYWELWYADAALAIQLQSQVVAVTQRDQAAARAQSGSLAPAEVLTFETQVATRDEDILSAQTERDRRAHELSRALGNNEHEQRYEVQAEPATDRTSFAAELVEQDALAHSAELHERSAAVALARLRAKTADDPNKPRLDLDGYVQTQGLGNESVSDAAEMFVSGDIISAMVGLTYEAPVRSHVRRAEAAKARLAVEVAEQQLREAKQRVLSEVRTALDREAAGKKKLALSEQTTAIAARQLAAEQARYASGSSTSLAVLEAEDKLRAAQLRLARARADIVENALVLEHLTGSLLERYAAK